MITAVLLCYSRPHNMDRIIAAWLAQEEVTEVIVCDNTGRLQPLQMLQYVGDPGECLLSSGKRLVVLSSSRNYGTYIRYVAPLLAENDIICWGDDDLLPQPGLMKDLLEIWDENRLVGIMGKNFTGRNYYTATGFRGENIEYGKMVDYLCGLCILSAKKNFVGFSPMQIPTKFWSGRRLYVMGDWWWEHWLREEGNPVIELWVSPTDKYRLLKEATDQQALHVDEEFQEVREYYYRRWVTGEENRELHEIASRFTPS